MSTAREFRAFEARLISNVKLRDALVAKLKIRNTRPYLDRAYEGLLRFTAYALDDHMCFSDYCATCQVELKALADAFGVDASSKVKGSKAKDDKSPYERAVAQGVVKKLGIKRCTFCKGKGHVHHSVCINCEGMGGVTK